jgi:hypothetical protein
MTKQLETLDREALVTASGGMTKAQAERAAAQMNNPPKNYSVCWTGNLHNPRYVACVR